jgi:hypothetical protein
MELEGSRPSSQKPTSGPIPEPFLLFFNFEFLFSKFRERGEMHGYLLLPVPVDIMHYQNSTAVME